MKIFQSSCSYNFPPIKSINFKSYLTWLRFEPTNFGKNKPLTCLNQLSYWNRQEMGQFFKTLCMRERERKKKREGGRSELKQYSTFILSTLLPTPPLSFSLSWTNRTVHSFRLLHTLSLKKNEFSSVRRRTDRREREKG